jgi:tetratricopeptide (TPR) repeat protein
LYRERATRLLMAALLVAGMSCLAYADALDLLKAGLAARIRGDFAAAVDFYTQAIDTGRLSSADLGAVLTSRGVAYDMMGQTTRAIDDFTAAIRLNPDHSDPYIHRGLEWVKQREFNRAIADFSDAIARDPSRAFLALNDRGNAYEAVGEYDRAIEDYARVIQLDPSDAAAYYNRAGAEYAKFDFDRAIEDYSRAIRLKPDSPQAYNNRGVVYGAKGAFDEAIADFDVVLRLNPNDAAVLGNRGSIYVAKGQLEPAVADFTSAIKLKPNIAGLYVNRARAELYLGQTEAATADVTTALRLKPSDAYAVIWLHLAHVRAGVDDQHELARNSANVDHKKWPGPVVDLHLGATSPETFSVANLSNVDARVRPERACEIAFYLGTFYLEQHDRNEAKRRFEAAINACPPSLIELGAAKAELTRLQSTR